MCYSTALRKSREKIVQKLLSQLPADFEIPEEYQPYFHLNGFTHGNLYIIKMDEPASIYPASWGLVPTWANKDPQSFLKKSNTLNARSETIFEKSSFKQSAEEQRCLILSDGFYEPHHENGMSIPYFCYQPSKEYPEGDLFMFAGFIRSWMLMYSPRLYLPQRPMTFSLKSIIKENECLWYWPTIYMKIGLMKDLIFKHSMN